ncbi:hypothetical protein GGR95_003714 [Sulfitobacter undariae]|uniref:Uncharacterized protein n=1 Tax=Sulfitobacter undariae TaxID=1563671 RepID=A0A7W6H2Q7_9RHOB|nr:hypothetical protein [Sulfitobacter undariae]
MKCHIYNPAPPNALAKEIRRRAQIATALAQLKADLFTGAIYGD